MNITRKSKSPTSVKVIITPNIKLTVNPVSFSPLLYGRKKHKAESPNKTKHDMIQNKGIYFNL